MAWLSGRQAQAIIAFFPVATETALDNDYGIAGISHIDLSKITPAELCKPVFTTGALSQVVVQVTDSHG